MKVNFICFIIFIYSFSLFGQSNDNIAIKIYLGDAETGKNICNAKVTLEGFEVPDIAAKYNKEGKFYYFSNSDYSKFQIIYINHKKKETQVLKKTKQFLTRYKIKLYKKGTSIQIDSTYKKILIKDTLYKDANYIKEDSIVDRIEKEISTLDHYKMLIMLKNSSNMTYSKIKAKIDSLVKPYGLEYIDDLVPKMYFIRFFGSQNCSNIIGTSSIICSIDENKSLKEFFKKNTERIGILKGTHMCGNEDTSTDFFSENNHAYNNQYDWKKNCYVLAYRKKDKSSFRVENDPVLNKIKKQTNQIEFGKIRYDKIYFKERFIHDENAEFDKKQYNEIVKKIDERIMNYKFLEKYNKDYTRVMLMDHNIYNLYVDKKIGLYGSSGLVWKGIWTHSFILDDPKKQTTDIYNEKHCNLQRFIGYSFLFE